MERLRRRIIRNLAPHSDSNTGQPPDPSEARP